MLDLKEVPYIGWEDEYQKILKNKYVEKKYNRKKRVCDKIEYVKTYFPKIYNNKEKKDINVLDIGAGPGEFLEVCRSRGCNVYGIDAEIGKSEMGYEYSILSKLMTERQKIKVFYNDAMNGIDINVKFDYINSQGAIEQIFKDYMVGIPHLYHKNCKKLSWEESQRTIDAMTKFLNIYFNLMKTKGIFFIYANGAKNNKFYCEMLNNICEKIKNIDLREMSERQHYFIRR